MDSILRDREGVMWPHRRELLCDDTGKRGSCDDTGEGHVMTEKNGFM